MTDPPHDPGFEDRADEPPTVTSEDREKVPQSLPKKIGRYTVRRAIASGGMGTVYEALQDHPRRPVAVKVMKHGVASRSALRRFEYESQILARLRHPCVAQVYEAGTHTDGTGEVPFFAMEYVPNAKHITDYAEDKKLTTNERMELLAKVCDGVHHGHQKGIIHRDLKPGNILVDPAGMPKIIDFGVARATDSDMALTTLQTNVGQLVGSFQYMSPEQCEAEPSDIDTRSDVYSLAVVLYELLCGRPPYDVKGVTIPEAVRRIREQVGDRPGAVNPDVSSDAETIVLKALEKERERRYQSASELAQDIRRYLRGEAIVARAPSIAYHLRVLARRNRALFLTAATALVILVAGVVVTTSLWVQSRANRARAESEASKALATLAYLQKMLSSPDPAQVGHDVRVLDLLERSDATMGQAFADQPEVEATVRMTIGLTYAGLDFWDAAKPHFAAALELRRNVLGEEHPDTLTAMHNLGISLQMQGRSSGQIDEAEQLYNRVLELRRKVLGEEHPDTISSIEKVSWIFRDRKQFTEAEPLFYRAVELRRRVQGEDHPDTITSVSYLSHLLGDQGKLEEAEKLSRDVLARSRRVLGELHPDTVVRISTLGYRLVQQGRWDEAEPIYREALTFHREVFGDRHPTTLHVQRRLIEVLEQLGKLEEAGGLRANLGDSP